MPNPVEHPSGYQQPNAAPVAGRWKGILSSPYFRYMLVCILFLLGLWRVVIGMDLAWAWHDTDPGPPWSDLYVLRVPVDVGISPDTATAAYASASLTVGVIMLGVACLLAIKRFSLRLLVAIVLIAAGAGTTSQLLMTTNHVELATYINFDAKRSCLLDGRAQLEPSKVLSSHPSVLWKYVGISATDFRVVSWSVEDWRVDCRARLMLRLEKKFDDSQLAVLCKTYAQRIEQICINSAPDETRKALQPSWCRSDPTGEEYPFSHLTDPKIMEWQSELLAITKAKGELESVKRDESRSPDSKAIEIQRLEAYIQEHQSKADKILKGL